MDSDLLAALCIWDEAANQPYQGKVAVGAVIRNRMARQYQSDGTIEGTVLHPLAFSGFSFEFVGGKYQRVAFNLNGMRARADALFEAAHLQHVWFECVHAWNDSAFGCADFGKMHAADTVLYLNPHILSHLPAWADPAKRVAKIGDHVFYRA